MRRESLSLELTRNNMSVGLVRVILAESARPKFQVIIVCRRSYCMRDHDAAKKENGGNVTLRSCNGARHAIVERQHVCCVLLNITWSAGGRIFASMLSSNTVAAILSIVNNSLFREPPNSTLGSDDVSSHRAELRHPRDDAMLS